MALLERVHVDVRSQQRVDVGYLADRIFFDAGDASGVLAGGDCARPRLGLPDVFPSLVRLDHGLLGDVGGVGEMGALPHEEGNEGWDALAVEGAEGGGIRRQAVARF
ncbi:hypothetical protein [Candidatus Protofrankia californiensis]|uniref:hypothetical protein n=1 Tax=Candidatus Protofrankia californiensis TaxID=1839754 RepID=UPI001040F9EA|nr:hypothetical protein [Candidatus Protofrankia californiensis]